MKRWYALPMMAIAGCGLLHSCIEPPLHLPDQQPIVETELEVVIDVDVDLDSGWYYGWDDKDKEIFGEREFSTPSSFQIRRYYTGQEPYASHTSVLSDEISGYIYKSTYQWGYWDLLAWNNITTLDGVQSLRFDEETSLDYVTASTGQTMNSTRYQTRYTRSFYQPEMLYAAYQKALEISSDLKGFTYDEDRGVYVKKLNMQLQPVTYVYLTQVIIHHNYGRISGVDGNGNLSGMARSVNMNTGVAGSDAITVHYYVRFKTGCDKLGENVDIAGGRLLTFGMCDINGCRTKADEVSDKVHHYMDVNFQFSKGNDSTLVFDVTDQVRKKPRGGIITIELNADTIPIPGRKGGSGFDAVVKDFEDGGTHEFDI